MTGLILYGGFYEENLKRYGFKGQESISKS